MYDLRPILMVNGFMLVLLGIAMGVPALADLVVQHPDWQVFTVAAGFTIFVGGALVLGTRTSGSSQPAHLSVPQAFMLTTSAWLQIGVFGALPFFFSDLDLSLTDALFESVSGITTTGATVLTGLDTAPPGLLLWRAILQWLGGVGIIVMAIAVLPMLQVGGMQLFRLESSDTSDKILPRATQIAAAIGWLYLGISFACFIGYWLAGMSLFDALAHALTTIATGGFSTHDASIGYFDSAAVDTVSTIFMVLGSLPFVLYLQAVRGGWRQLVSDDQVQAFVLIAAAAITAMTFYLAAQDVAAAAMEAVDTVQEETQNTSEMLLAEEGAVVEATLSVGRALRMAAFNVVSIMTGTGYATEDYTTWGTFPVAFFFVIMFVGGCAGSTSCGIKIFRFQVMAQAAKVELVRLMRPHAIVLPRFNRRPLPEGVVQSVMSFFVLFAVAYGALALALAAVGLDMVTALSGAASAIANVGPGLGEIIGPAGTFESLPSAAKWILMAGMVLGRLELFTVLVFFAPSFWRG
ncbi:MAG: TrkH family potassium uptake protein [Alphaproteobacteria bacterium]